MAKKPRAVEKRNEPKRGLPAWVWMFMGSLLTLMIGFGLYLWNPLKSSVKVVTPQDGMQIENDEAQDSANEAKKNQSDTDSKNSQQAQKKEFEFYDILPEQQPTPIPDDVVVLEPTDTKPKITKPDVTLKQPKSDIQTDDDIGNAETYDGGAVVSADEAKTKEKTSSKLISEDAPKDAINNLVKNKVDAQLKNENDSTAQTKTRNSTDPIDAIVAKEKKVTYILQVNSFGSAEEADNRRAEVLLAGVDANVVKTEVADGAYLYQVISKVYSTRENVFLAQKRLQSSGIDSIVVERKK